MKRRMKKIMTVAVTAAMAISMLAGCGSSDEKSEGSNAGSKEVNVICWTEYLPQEVLDSFEEKTGITVNMTTYTSRVICWQRFRLPKRAPMTSLSGRKIIRLFSVN